MDVALMVEGQNGLTWDRWKRVARTAEGCGFDGLFRSDHFTNSEGPYRDSLELWTSLTWLAENTDTIDFGPLVTPVSFRHPVFTARMGKDVDNLADGRLVLGVGAGWQEREHETFGFDLLDLGARMDRFEEGVEVVSSLLRSGDPVSFDGDYYDLDDALLLPRPERDGGTRLLVGGNGKNRTLPLAAEYADEWNAVMLRPGDVADLNDHLDSLLDARGRDPDSVKRSMMTRVVYGRDEDEVEEVIGDADREALRENGAIVGTGEDVSAHLDSLADAGVERVVLQWLELDDVGRLEAFAGDVP